MLAKISNKGWIVIPAEIRRKYDLKPGSVVQVVDYGHVLSLVPVGEDSVESAAGMLKGGPSLTRSLLDERARERQREG